MSANESIKRLTKLISALSNGRVKEIEAESEFFVSEWTDSEELRELQQEVVALARKHLQAKEFILNLSEGNLEVEAPHGNRLVDPFKELQANLRHLVWQTREIAHGDYSQQIDFLGDFSDSFNSLVTALNEKKQIEEALQKSEEKYRLLHNYAGVGIGYYTPDGIVLSYNKIAASYLNGSPEDFIGKSIYSLFPKDIADFYMDRIKKAVNAEIDQQYEDKVELPKEVKWFQSVFTKILDSSNRVVGVQIISTDITEQKRTEESLKASETKFRDLFTQMNEGFALHELIYDANHNPVDYRILDINPAFEKQVGITIEKAKGALATQLYGVSPAPYIDIYAQVAKTGEYLVFQTYFPPLDRHFQISVFSPNSGNFATVFTDITEVKRAEEALRESEYQFKQLVDDMHVGVLLQGSQSEILLSNPTSLELLGLTESQLLGRTSFDPEWNVIHEDGSPFLGSAHPVPQAIESRQSVRNVVMGVYRPTTHDRIWLQVDAEPQLNSEGMVRQVVCTFIDISERKEAEEALKENESRLRELNATKDKFFSIISHDLKNPFNSILGLSNLLVEQIKEKDYEGIEQYAGIIQKASTRVYELLVNLLDWSRSQTGRMEFSPEYIELAALIKEVTELLNDSAQQKSITIIKQFPRNMLVFADNAMISTILRNLISNAIKFSHPGGQIVISADKNPDELTISISDNGVGIKKETEGKLFRIDENYTSLGTQNEKGTGLGLILCKEFIDKHGGRIWVESESGKGSTFYFAIPQS
jgi:two-component system, sensor histidine kinase and response regulator